MKILVLLVLTFIVLTVGGCSNPYISPDTSAAIHDREVMRELKVQTEMMKEQTALLSRIANGTESQSGNKSR